MLMGASQVAAMPINNETNTHMCYAITFMPAAGYTVGVDTVQTINTDQPTVPDQPTVAVAVPTPRLIIEEPRQPII